MKKFLLLLPTIFLFLGANGQFTKNWESHYNGVGDFTDRIRDMVADNAGNVFVTGYTYQRANQRDLFIAKYSSIGDLIWYDTYQNIFGEDDDGEAITIDHTGDVIVVGESNKDYVVLKYDTNGSRLWVKTYNGVGLDEDYAYQVVVDSNNNIYVTGDSEQGPADSEITTVKYSSSGDQLWVKTFSSVGAGNDRTYDLLIDSSDGIYIAGRYFNGNDFDGILLKYNTSGTLMWSSSITNTGDDRYAVLHYDGANIYACGRAYNGSNDDFYLRKFTASGMLLWTQSEDNGDDDRIEAIAGSGTDVWLAGRSRAGTTYFDMVLLKYNSSGNKTVEKSYAIGADSRPRDLAVIGTDVYVGGKHEINLQDDLTLIKYNTNGDQLWVKSFNDTGDGRDEIQKMLVTPNNNILVAGRSYHNTSQSNGLLREYQPNGNLNFSKSFAGNGDNRDIVNDITIDDAGNSILTGYTYKKDNRKNLLVIKQDPNGNLMWVDTLSSYGSGRDEGIAVETDSSNNIYMTGFLNNNIITIKYQPNGNLIWGRVYNGSAMGQDRASDLLINSSNEIYVLGRSDVDPSSASNDDILLIKYDANGTLLWSETIAHPEDEQAYEMAFDTNENIYLVINVENGLTTEAYLYKFDPSGNQQWFKSMVGGGNDRFREVATTNDRVIVAGRLFNGTDNDAVIASYDFSGNLEWSSIIDENIEDTVQDLQVTPNGEAVVSIRSSDNQGARTTKIIKYDNSGIVQWNQTLDVNLINDINTLAIDESNGLLFGGGSYRDASDEIMYLKAFRWQSGNTLATTTFQGGTYGENEARELVLSGAGKLLVSCYASYDEAQEDFTTLEYFYEKPVRNEDIIQESNQIYPSLVESGIDLTAKGEWTSKNYNFRLFDTSGSLIVDLENLIGTNIPLNSFSLAPAIYFYQITTENQAFSGSLFIE